MAIPERGLRLDGLRLGRDGRRLDPSRLQPQQGEARAAHRECQHYTQPSEARAAQINTTVLIKSCTPASKFKLFRHANT